MLDTDTLKQQIQEEEETLAAKKLMLKTMEKKKTKKYFNQTKFGRAYYSVLNKLTYPFVSLHTKAGINLEQPLKVQSERLLNQNQELLEKAQDISRDKNPIKANSICEQLISAHLKTETFLENHPEFKSRHQLILDYLEKAISRLRLPKEEQNKTVNQFLDDLEQKLSVSLSGEETTHD